MAISDDAAAANCQEVALEKKLHRLGRDKTPSESALSLAKQAVRRQRPTLP